MATELAKAYDPKDAQQKCLELWTRINLGHSEPDGRKPYSIVIPPPNVTGELHMGHALNNTLQDVLIRWRRMKGYNAEWMPGTDHAGIATQAVVERRIWAEEKKTRHDLGREELVRRIWLWKDQYEKRILGQLKQLGCSADWPRTRFTLDEGCSRAVRETFFRMFRDGYIFRGKRLVNWDTHLQTSVSDDETYTEDVKGGFWTFKYPVKGSDEFIRFSTTRPETMLGDTAVCVHPSDERYKHLIGKTVTIPLVNREIPIIADAMLADPELGTGCVKVTPAHDPNDYACYTRHPEIGIINILNPDGTINENGGKYQGLERYKAREAVVKEMEELGLFEGKEDRVVPMKFSDRSKTPIEPYLSDQWFVKMGDREDGNTGFAQLAMDAVTGGRVKFFPERYKNTYLEWLGEKRDWCISRQLWWGHRIPVWSLNCDTDVVAERVFEEIHRVPEISEAVKLGIVEIQLDSRETQSEVVRVTPGIRQTRPTNFIHLCLLKDDEAVTMWMKDFIRDGHKFTQSEDVLDTWFSSMLWTHSTFGWPEQTPEVKYYYPTSTLVTSRDIITLWVARMVIAGLYNLGEVPFREVYITPKMLDGFGEGMSKSKGNGVDPLDIIDMYGTDALRYQMVSIAGETQDSRLPVSNVCPHCGEQNAVKQEHMYMRTKKLACIKCKKQCRPGGPWPDEDPELPTAKQASERFEIGRNFANKLWNATRFVLRELDGYTPTALDVKSVPVEDRWILSRLATTANAVTEQLEGYRFNEVARTIYDFTWSEFCDWYIEMAKGRLKEPGDKVGVQQVLVAALDGILRLVHPVMPFVTESIWQALNQVAPERGLPTAAKAPESIAVASWPAFPAEWINKTIEQSVAYEQQVTQAVREVRSRYNIPASTQIPIVAINCSEPVTAHAIAVQGTQMVQYLGGVQVVNAGPNIDKPAQSSTTVTPAGTVYVSVAGFRDDAAEIKRLEKQVADKTKQLEGTKKKLANADFVAKAPPEVVASQRELIADLEKQIASMHETIKEMKG